MGKPGPTRSVSIDGRMNEATRDPGPDLGQLVLGLTVAIKDLAEAMRRHRVDAAAPHSRPNPYLTASETMEYLRLTSHSSLYHLIREHGMPHGRRGRVFMFDMRELNAWIKGFGSAIDMARVNRRRPQGRFSTAATLEG